MKNHRIQTDKQSQIETKAERGSQLCSSAESGAKGARLAVASLALCAAAWAQSAESARVPRPIPHSEDVKTPAPVLVKTGVPAIDRPLSDSTSEPISHPKQASMHAARVDHSHVIYDGSSDGLLRARGATYKVEFSPEGTTYTPLLGAQAPRNYPVSFRLEGLSLSGRELDLPRDAAAIRSGESVRFERGAITEVYDLSAESIEQKFVIASLPSDSMLASTAGSMSGSTSGSIAGSISSGDLEVRIGVESDLSQAEGADGLELRNELGAVRYGRAEVVDALGHRSPATTLWAEHAIRIVVPGAFLAAAAFPVTIDPLISTFSIDNTLDEDTAPDVAFDAFTGNWITVYEEAISASDHDVIAIISETNGLAIPGGLYYIDNTSENWTKPRVADNNFAHQFMVVSECGTPGSHSIRARTINANGIGMSLKFVVSAQDAGDMLNPDIGGDPSSAGTSYYCVVWERVYSATDHDIHAALVTSDRVVSSVIYLENSSGTLDSNPSISKSDGLPPYASQEWNVVWQRLFAPGDHDVFGAQIHWDGSITTPTTVIFWTSFDETNPRVSSLLDGGAAARPYLMVCSCLLQGQDHDVLAALLSGGAPLDTAYLNLLDSPATLTKDQIGAVVESDGHQFVVAYSEQYADNSPDYDPYLTTFNSAGNVLGVTEARVQLSNASAREDELALVAMHSGGAQANGFMAAWRSYTAAHGNDIGGALYQSYAGGPKTTFCFGVSAACPCANDGSAANGCGNSQNAQGGHLDAVGTAQVSADSLVLQGTGMPSPSTCLYFQGSGSNPHVVGDGLICAGVGLVRLGAKANVNGASTFGDGNDPHLAVKGNVPAVGGTRYYQVWYRDNHAFCTAETYNFTNGVEVVWVP